MSEKDDRENLMERAREIAADDLSAMTASWLDTQAFARALLSSPRVEEVRREALEEAAKVADEMAVNRARVSQAAEYASRSIAERIRALSPPVGSGIMNRLRARQRGELPRRPADETKRAIPCVRI